MALRFSDSRVDIRRTGTGGSPCESSLQPRRTTEPPQNKKSGLPTSPTVRSNAPTAPASEALAVKMDAIELRGKAGQFDWALSLSHKLSRDLESNPWTDIPERRPYQALAHMLTGEIYALRKQWGIACEHYETAADFALNPEGIPVSVFYSTELTVAEGDQFTKEIALGRERHVSNLWPLLILVWKEIH